MQQTKLLLSAIAIILIATTTTLAQKRTYTTKRTDTPPVIDGRYDKTVWDAVEWGGDFIQSIPNEGEKPGQKTAFKILYDDNNLYVFIKALDLEPAKISRLMSRRDYFTGDFVEINIDSDFDQQTAFSFTAMVSGAKGDEAITKNGSYWDPSWNPIWYLKTSIDAEGWNAEMRIPFTQLRFGKKEAHIWGLQVMRHLYRKNERSTWQLIPRDAPGLVHLFGELHGIKNIKPKRQVEITPYVMARAQRFKKEEGNPFRDGSLSNLSTGIDGKIGITNDLTLDFTINPDFGQVEADPSEVNLTVFETFFPEKRPFFVERKSIYDFRLSNIKVPNQFGSDNLFYSRRIGRSPSFYPKTGDNQYVKMPENTTILGALKLSGKTKNGLSVGILESVTAKERAKIAHLSERRKETVEPLTNYFVGRVQKDFNKGETILGGMLTAVNRNISNDNLDFLHKAAYTGGIDFMRYWKDRTYYLGANGLFSHVMGNKEAILQTQTVSARYYQRADANHLDVDSTLTSLSGYGGSVKIGKGGSGRIRFESSLNFRSPGFEINDVGYMRTADIIHHGTWMGYHIQKPFSIFNTLYINNNYWLYWNFDGKLLSKHMNINFSAEFKNNWGLYGRISGNSERLLTNALRGGPALIEPGGLGGSLGFYTDSRKKLKFDMGRNFDRGNSNSWKSYGYWLDATYKPTNSVSVSFSADIYNNWNNLQYVSTTEINNEARYIFAELDQKTIYFTARFNVSITPDLSIQYYGQPFISAGKYKNFKRITDSRAGSYKDRYETFTGNNIAFNSESNRYAIDENNDGTTDYSFKNPNFDFFQFRSNLVARWEYIPGSTLYLVWSQGRTRDDDTGKFSFKHGMRDLFDVYPDNIFLIKLSYTLSP